MFEHAAGGQHHRILVVGYLIGRNDLGRHDLAAAAFSRETGGENDLVARLVRTIHGIGHRTLTHQPLPGNVLERRHQLRHLRENLARTCVIPGQPHPLAYLLDDPEILPCIAGWLDHLPRQLHAAISVGEGAGFFRERRGWQNNVSVERGLGDEQILHYKMVQHGQRLARMLQVGVRHRRVFALDIHAVNGSGMDGIHDLDDG